MLERDTLKMSIISQVNAVLLASKRRFSTENTSSLNGTTLLLCAWQLLCIRFIGILVRRSRSVLLFLLTAGVLWSKRSWLYRHQVESVANSLVTWLLVAARVPFSSYRRPLVKNLGEEFLQLLEDFRSMSRLWEAALEQLYWLKNFNLELLIFNCKDRLLQYVISELVHA